MVSVNTKSELKNVLRQRITNFVIEDKKLRASTVLASKIHDYKLTDLVPASLVNNAICSAVGVTTGVAITLIICISAIFIVAILKDYDVELEVDPKTGKTKAIFNKNKLIVNQQ